MASAASEPLKVALVGTGMYAKSAYVPMLRKIQDKFVVTHVWSRAEESATSFVSEHFADSQGCTAVHGEDGFKEVVSAEDIQAVIIVLPAHIAQPYILSALRGGKSVLSEKPIARTLAEGRAAIEEHKTMQNNTIWMVGENYRFENAFHAAAKKLPLIGDLVKADLVVDMGMRATNPYFVSSWRRDKAAMPGGFMVDYSVHHMAALRVVLGKERPVRARAVTSSRPGSASVPDTIVGSISCASGLEVAVSLTLSAVVPKHSITVTGTNGTVETYRGGFAHKNNETLVRCRAVDQDGVPGQATEEVFGFPGFANELNDFHRLVRSALSGETASAEGVGLGSVEEALLDMAMIEALIKAGETGSVVDVA